MQDDEKCKCGRTLKDGYCLPCQQDLNFQRSLEMDRAKTMRNSKLKTLETNEAHRVVTITHRLLLTRLGMLE